MKKIGLVYMALVLAVSVTSAAALNIGLNPATPLQGFDLGGGWFATLIGVQDTVGNDLIGETITAADLHDTIISGTVGDFYYADGNTAGAIFANIVPFALFVSDDVMAGNINNTNPGRIWDSLYATHQGEVVFSNSSGGTTTMGTGGQRIPQNPFAPTAVPDGGLTLALLGLGLAGLKGMRRMMVD